MKTYHITKSAGTQWIEYQQTPKPSKPAARTVTIQQKLGHIRHLLQYAVSQDWVSENVFWDLKLPVGEVSASRERTKPFSDAELVTVSAAINEFIQVPTKRVPNHPPLAQRLAFLHLSRLLAYAGARLTEMQQLNIKDVYQIDGIWVANLVTLGDDGKRLKNNAVA
jgi:hypothetical protein